MYPQPGPPSNWYGPPQNQQQTPYMSQPQMPPGKCYLIHTTQNVILGGFQIAYDSN